MSIIRESWGQPPISIYTMDRDGENLHAIAELDGYGELTCSNYFGNDMIYLTSEDLTDLALFDLSFNEPTISWEDIKKELTKDGLI